MIEEHKDWQEHMYDPGYYVGGKAPHWMNSKNRNLKIALILIFLLFIFSMIFS